MKRFYQMAILSCMASLTFSCAAAAAPSKTTWTSYLYQGPGSHYSVIDEVPQATIVDDAACEGEWCKVTLGGRVGFMRAEVLEKGALKDSNLKVLPQPAAALTLRKPSGPCVVADQTGGNGGNAATVFCQR